MPRPHKHSWTGVDIETTLPFEQLANMAERAAQQSTGDLAHGRHKIVSTRTTDRRIEFLINDYLVSYKKCMVFHLDFAHRDERSWVTSQIDWYDVERPKVVGVPTGSKTMVAYHTYMQFARSLAHQVRAADSRAKVTVREGKRPKSVTTAARESEAFNAPSAQASRPSADQAAGRSAHPGSPPVPPSARSGLAQQQVPASVTDPSIPRARAVSSVDKPTWRLQSSDGQLVEVSAAVVLGRNPSPPATAPTALPVALRDQWLSVSKTHALVQVCDDGLWVTDLGSTNGTRLRDPDGDEFACEAGSPHRVDTGWVINFGEFRVRVARA